ncbi:triacylglycerol lipase [Schizosaccharomyces japonicus yFS275]|uniref:Triacylglycerol lipase n=1 Tax=Schizosaccharomyces japonicus (strain yFS275 / FY16936) TaxID=402676 RepID=B6K1H8_SCHJY|nr:triacylglycerol lipase [Schizosaccharomyces japonicus yFS275]EEB07799.1 triacylglycerol lipase [Schizosaccharomyces japonicus yFS275]
MSAPIMDLGSDLRQSYVNETDLDDFRNYTSQHQSERDKRIEYIEAQHDWNPINERVQRFSGRQRRDEKREGFTYPLLRWPLMLFSLISLVITGSLYIFTRLFISIHENVFIWRGEAERLRKRLNKSTSYEEWKTNAIALDKYLGHDEWFDDPKFAYYDYTLVGTVLSNIRKHRKEKNWEALKSTLDVCVRSNFAGLDSPMLYSQTYYGTKKLVDEFYTEVTECLQLLLTENVFDEYESRRVFQYFARNFGRTALCLSGGASFSFYHLGVVRALLDENLLPSVITGTSGGGLVAALLCTRTNEELKEIIVPQMASHFESQMGNFMDTIVRYVKTGARFSEVAWARTCMWFTRGSMTFAEAYERTGRILNITVVPSDVHSPPKIINYLTAPNTIIWSAVIASCAVPGILRPVPLMTRSVDGKLIPYNFGNRWRDGSLRTDIPLAELRTQFNVHYSIVSQTNPHIQIFFFSPRGAIGRPVSHRKGQGWRGGYLGSALEQYLKFEMIKWLHVVRSLELLPRPFGQDWSNVFLQRFEGTVTIWPKTLLSDFYYILDPPTEQRLGRMILAGKRASFPKLKFISYRMEVEKLIEQGRAKYDATELGTAADGDVGTVLSTEDVRVSKESADIQPVDVSYMAD